MGISGHLFDFFEITRNKLRKNSIRTKIIGRNDFLISPATSLRVGRWLAQITSRTSITLLVASGSWRPTWSLIIYDRSSVFFSLFEPLKTRALTRSFWKGYSQKLKHFWCGLSKFETGFHTDAPLFDQSLSMKPKNRENWIVTSAINLEQNDSLIET